MDTLTAEKRSWNMAQIRSKDTSIEVIVRRYLFARGFRFRKNDKRFPGKPDIVLPKYKTVVFIHGCFWHRHPGCKRATTPKTRIEYWKDKFNRNIANDANNVDLIREKGWNPIVIWECEINNHFDETMKSLLNELNSALINT